MRVHAGGVRGGGRFPLEDRDGHVQRDPRRHGRREVFVGVRRHRRGRHGVGETGAGEGYVRVGASKGEGSQLFHRVRQNRARPREGLRREHQGGAGDCGLVVQRQAGGAGVAGCAAQEGCGEGQGEHAFGSTPEPSGGVQQRRDATWARAARQYQHPDPGRRRGHRHARDDPDPQVPAAARAGFQTPHADSRRGHPGGSRGAQGRGAGAGQAAHGEAVQRPREPVRHRPQRGR